MRPVYRPSHEIGRNNMQKMGRPIQLDNPEHTYVHKQMLSPWPYVGLSPSAPYVPYEGIKIDQSNRSTQIDRSTDVLHLNFFWSPTSWPNLITPTDRQVDLNV